MRYGKRPNAVKKWSVNEFDEAFIVWQGEGEYHLTASEVNEDLDARVKAGNGFLLDRDFQFWSRFIEDGELNEDALLAKNYSPEQLPYIREEMRRFGWIRMNGHEKEK